MPLDVHAVREGIADALATISGLSTYFYVPDDVHPPAAVVHFPEQIEYQGAMGGALARMQIPVEVLVAGNHPESAGIALDALASRSGIHSAINDDRTLGGAAQSAIVVDASDFRPVTVNGALYLTFRTTIEVLA